MDDDESKDGTVEEVPESNFGKNRLAEKQAELDAYKENDIDPEQLIGMAAEISREVRKELGNTAREIVKSLTPGFLQRYFNKKIHIGLNTHSDERAQQIRKDTRNTVIESKRYFRSEKKKHKKFIKKQKKEKLDRSEETALKEEWKEKGAQDLIDDYKKRREEQLKEIQEKNDARLKAVKDKAQADLLAKRQYNMTHWGEVASTAHKQAVENKEKYVADRHTRYTKQINRLYNEWDERDYSRTKSQVAPTNPVDPPIGLEEGPNAYNLGVFGTPMGREAYHGILGDGGHKPVLDDHTVGIFHSEPFKEYEESTNSYNESYTMEKTAQAMYDALTQSSHNLKIGLDKMSEMKDLFEKDQFQQKQEMMVVQRDQIGPPRREPHNHEIEPTHIRKTRIVDLQSKIDEFQHYIEQAKVEKESVDKQLLATTQRLAVLKETNKKKRTELDRVNGGLGHLPMVIGKNISKMPGNDMTYKPKELMNAITFQSRFTELEHMVDYTIKTHKERNELDQQLWVARQSSGETRQEANLVVNRLAEISAKMQKGYVETAKANLVDALKVFHTRQNAGQVKLQKVEGKLSGLLPWFVHRDMVLSKNVISFKSSSAMGGITFEIDPEVLDEDTVRILSNGVTLGSMRWGFCVGVIDLPKNAMWSVLITISRQGNSHEFVNNDESDRVEISMGNSIGTLTTQLIAFNKVNPATGAVLYDVKYIFRGSSVAFRFDFQSSSTDPKKHLAVSVGQYEEYEMVGVEHVEAPKPGGRQRLLSSYVKMMRIDEQQGKFRETKLLEELVAIEESNSKFWDSDIVSRVPQRYAKDYFLRILKAEILLEQKAGKARLMATLDKQAKIASKLGKTINKQEQMRDASLDEFLRRKRMRQSHVLDEGKALINKKIEVFDPSSNTWRHVLIKDCVTRWLDNGLTAKCTHIVHEHNEGMELLGVQFEVDLSKVRWFESAIQELDEDAMIKWRRQKQFEARLKEIDTAVESKILEFRTEYEQYRREEENALRAYTSKTIKKLDKNIEKMAEARSKMPLESREIKSETQRALMDLRVGLIPIDTSVKPGEQAAAIAIGRWKTKWMEKKRTEVMDKLLEREQHVEDRINNRRMEFIDLEKEVVKVASAERYSMVAQIREYKANQKQKMMKRVKFKKSEFAKAVPMSQQCEHLRTKNWGDNYAVGIRCKDCGKELSEIHSEENQVLGYGSGCTDELYDAIKRHRYDEAAFKFKDADELALVESERVRIEKERRVMEETEAFFYDFNDLRVIYDFDRRHAKFIKQNGVFRQGLQWTEEELRKFELDMKYQEMERIKKENLVDTLIEKFDPLNCIEEPPPTLRGQDEKRKANYYEFMFMMGRLHTYQKKIAYLKEERLELLSERRIYSVVLEFLHKESYAYDQELSGIEQDLDKTGLLLATFERMQNLWKSANRIMAQANKDKMRAEMRQCGVWEDVRDAFENMSFLHDETLSLLKVKFWLDNNLEGTRRRYEEQKRLHAEKKELLHELQRKTTTLTYCRPGDLAMTPYGDGIIRQYREKDDMLLISLSFGEPFACLWIRGEEIAQAEKARSQGEIFLMDIEDNRTRKFFTTEKNQCKREIWAMMREEEGMKEFWTFQDLGSAQDSTVKKAITKAVKDKYIIMDSENFKRVQAKTVDAKFEVAYKEQKELYREYVGPKAGRPKQPTFFWQWQQRKEIQHELKEKFLIRAAEKAEYDANESFYKVRADWIQDHAFMLMINDTVIDMIKEVAKDTYREGRNAKLSAERLSGLIFPNPRHMQYDAYRSMVEVWKFRKADLKQRIEVNKGIANKATKEKEVLSDEELMLIKAQKRRERQERLRQKALIKEMMVEDETLKVFYEWELKQNLMERRLMKQEDADMKRLIKEEEKQRKEAEEERRRGYLVSDKLAEEAAAKKNSKADGFENRRKQLQDEVIERRRKAEEHAMMILEDKFGEALREVDIKDRLMKKMAKQLGMSQEELMKKQNAGMIKMETGDDDFVQAPDWFEAKDFPEGWDDWPPARQKSYIKEKEKVRERQMVIDNKIDVENTLLDKLEDASYDQWREMFVVVEQEEMETELQCMGMEEVAKQYEFDLQELEANIRKIMNFCHRKGEEELRAKTTWEKKKDLARKRDRELGEAEAWLALCIKRSKQRDKIKRKIVENCLWIDTDSISGFHQRFKTELLRKRLYWGYFRRILDSIITRAEIIASERRMMGIQEHLSLNHATLTERTEQMRERWREIQRDEYMRMRKSILNQKFFPKHRRDTLYQKFSSWVRFFLWNRGHREAYELRYELIKTQMDIDRQFKDQLGRHTHDDKHLSELEKKQTKYQKSFGASTMLKVREHPVQCQDCKIWYLEAMNHSMSCAYHFEPYSLQCPRDCPNPGLTAKCSSHRIRRWTCCDSTRPDAVGCSRKYHTPKAQDQVFRRLLNGIIERDRKESLELDKKLEIARNEKWEEKMMEAKRGQVLALEEKMGEAKAKVKAYDNIKWE